MCRGMQHSYVPFICKLLTLAVGISLASAFNTPFGSHAFSRTRSLGQHERTASLLCPAWGHPKALSTLGIRLARHPMRVYCNMVPDGSDESENLDAVKQKRVPTEATQKKPKPGMVYRRSSMLRKPTERVQKLRDLLFRKEAFAELTSAEFSLKLDLSIYSRDGNEDDLRSIAAIDYDRIARSLSTKYTAIYTQGAGKTVMSPSELRDLADKLMDMLTQVQQRMREGKGITSVAGYFDSPPEQQEEKQEEKIDVIAFFSKFWDNMHLQNLQKAIDKAKSLAGEVKKEEEKLETYMQAFLREDGSLDFDAVKVPKREELVKMGGELWERLNGMPPGEEQIKNITALKIAVRGSPRVLQFEKQIEVAETSVKDLSQVRLGLYAELDRFRQGDFPPSPQLTDIGEPWARVNGRNGTYTQQLSEVMGRLRKVERDMVDAEQRLRLRQLDLDMERIALYIEYELEQGDEVQDLQKLLVAEFGLLDAQISTLTQMAEEGEEAVLNELEEDEFTVTKVGLVDEDELMVVAGDVADLLRRLGVDAVVGPDDRLEMMVPKFSFGEVQQKIMDGAQFYLQGTKLMASDWVYASSLMYKAGVRGQTLQPREVRTLRRAFKDTITFIPFIVILLIPLSPVGHVLIFSFIQRFFPDFFPSPYTDRRQNLMRMYQAVEMTIPAESRNVGRITASAASTGRRLRSTRTLIQQNEQMRPGSTRPFKKDS